MRKKRRTIQPPPMRSRRLVSGKEMLEEMERRRRGLEISAGSTSQPSGSNAPPQRHEDGPLRIGLSSQQSKLNIKAQVNKNISEVKGEQFSGVKSERGTKLRSIKAFLVQNPVQCLKVSNTECKNSSR